MSVELVGPFPAEHVIVIDGRVVPHLVAELGNGGQVYLCLDRRISLAVPVADLDRIATFVADCIAVGMGYTCHPREGWDAPIPRPKFPTITGLTFVGGNDDD